MKTTSVALLCHDSSLCTIKDGDLPEIETLVTIKSKKHLYS